MSTEPQRGEEKAQGWGGGWQGPGRGMSVKVAGRSLSLSSTEFTGRPWEGPSSQVFRCGHWWRMDLMRDQAACEGQGTRKGAGEGPSEVIRKEGLE